MAFKLLCLFAVVAASQAFPFIDSRIVNGVDVEEGEIPYQVSLQYKSSDFHFCGGSVLNQNYVLTAAHCVVGKKPEDIIVIAGVVDYLKKTYSHEVEAITTHKGYNPNNSWEHDIAVIKVKVPFEKVSTISSVPLPVSDEPIKGNDKAVVSGWGRLWQGGETSNFLKRANIVIADQDYCRDIYKNMQQTIHKSHVCAYDPDTPRGSCHGDSGGPLTVNGKIVGIVSWAKACALTDYPTVYTRVSSYLDWIEENAV